MFERTLTGSEIFFILRPLDASKFVFVSVFTIVEICPKIRAKPPSTNEKRPLPVDVLSSKTSLLKAHQNLAKCEQILNMQCLYSGSSRRRRDSSTYGRLHKTPFSPTPIQTQYFNILVLSGQLQLPTTFSRP